VVGDHPQADVIVVVRAVAPAGHFLGAGDDGVNLVDLVEIGDALEEVGDPLKAHAGVDVLLGQRLEGAVLLAVVLCEDAVPILKKAVTVTARGAAGLAAAMLGALVVVELAARAAGAGGTGRPKVVFLAQAGDMGVGDA